jgi:hypothetical protein
VRTLPWLALLTTVACTPTTGDSNARAHSVELTVSNAPPGERKPAVSTGAAKPDAPVYGEAPCRFRAKFPATPEVASNDDATPILGPVTEHVARVRSDGVVFLTTCWDSSAAHIPVTEESFRGARDDFVGALKGSTPTIKAITLDGHTGEEVVFESAKLGPVRARFYRVDQRVYLVATVGKDHAAAAAFFDSFRIID